jgi:hypothetical protein
LKWQNPKRVKTKQNSRAFAISTGTLSIDAFAGKAFPKEGLCDRAQKQPQGMELQQLQHFQLISFFPIAMGLLL